METITEVRTYYESGQALKFAEEDIYEDGCQPDTARSYSVDITCNGETMTEVVEKLKAFYGVDWDAIELNACDEDGRLDIELLEDRHGDSASLSKIDAWKKGQCRLWYAVYSYYIKKIVATVERIQIGEGVNK